jgi:hypothetical protein
VVCAAPVVGGMGLVGRGRGRTTAVEPHPHVLRDRTGPLYVRFVELLDGEVCQSGRLYFPVHTHGLARLQPRYRFDFKRDKLGTFSDRERGPLS